MAHITYLNYSRMDLTTAKAYISVALSGADPKAKHLCQLVDMRACEGWCTWATAPPHEIAIFNEFPLTKKSSLINQAMAAISAKTPAEFEAQKPIYQRRYAEFVKDFCDLTDIQNTRLNGSINYVLQENAELRRQLVGMSFGLRFVHAPGWESSQQRFGMNLTKLPPLSHPLKAYPAGNTTNLTRGVTRVVDMVDGEGGEADASEDDLQSQSSDAHADESCMLADDEK